MAWRPESHATRPTSGDATVSDDAAAEAKTVDDIIVESYEAGMSEPPAVAASPVLASPSEEAADVNASLAALSAQRTAAAPAASSAVAPASASSSPAATPFRADFIHGGAGHAAVLGGGGNDRLISVNTNAIMMGGSGDDALLSLGREASGEFLLGGSGNDCVFDVDLSAKAVLCGAGEDKLRTNTTSQATLSCEAPTSGC